MNTRPKGRKRKYAEYDALVESLPNVMKKRPKYLNGIGVFRGARGETAWIKITLPHGTVYRGKSYRPREPLEIKLGNLASWSWQQLEQKYLEMKGKADRGEPLEETTGTTFSEWAEQWLTNAKDRLRSFPTIQIHVRKQFIPLLGSQALSNITVGHVNSWIAKRLKGAKPATVRRELATLGCILNDAVKASLLDTNPTTKANSIQGVTGRKRFLSGEEILKLLEFSEKEADWLTDLILWFLHSGMRKSEVTGLLWTDIKTLPNRAVVIELQNTKSGGGRTVTATKTMRDIIGRQKKRRKENDNRLFPYAAITIRRKWKRVREKAGLLDTTMHDLRRTHSTHAVISGVDLRTLAGRIGHSDLTMLEKHYAALVSSAENEAAQKIEKVFEEIGYAQDG